MTTITPTEIKGDKDSLFKHFFQIIQTKSLLLEEAPIVIAKISSKDQMVEISNIFKRYVNGKYQIDLYILFCSNDPLFELSKSRAKEDDIQSELKELKYILICNDDNIRNFYIETAANVLSKDENATEKIIIHKSPLEKRQAIFDMMTCATIKEHPMGIIEFYDNDILKDTSYCTFYDKSIDDRHFVSCMTLGTF